MPKRSVSQTKNSAFDNANERPRGAKSRDYEAAVVQMLKRLFPGCPGDVATRIAAWTCRKGSGRVGRSAAAKELDAQALRLAVLAHIRHAHTRYDELLMKHGDRAYARELVRGEIEKMVARWEQGRELIV